MKVSRRVYLLLLIIEECSEIIHRTCKAIRFGLKERWKPEDGTNQKMLEDEIGDLQTILSLNYSVGNITQTNPSKAQSDRKIQRVEKFLDYSFHACKTISYEDEDEANPANCYVKWDEDQRTIPADTEVTRDQLQPGMQVICGNCRAVIRVRDGYEKIPDHHPATGDDMNLCMGSLTFKLFEKFVKPKLEKNVA